MTTRNKLNLLIYFSLFTFGLLVLYILNFTKYRLGGELIFYFNGVYTLVMTYLTKTLITKK